VTRHRRLKLDAKKLADAERALMAGRSRIASDPAGDPFWGPIMGDMGLALDVLRRKLFEEAAEIGAKEL
jgi:hypothetical protein